MGGGAGAVQHLGGREYPIWLHDKGSSSGHNGQTVVSEGEESRAVEEPSVLDSFVGE